MPETLTPFFVSPDDLLPSARRAYEELCETTNTVPRLKVTHFAFGVGMDPIRFSRQREGEDFVEIDAGMIQWTPEWVRRFHMTSDADILQRPYHNPDVEAATASMARALGLNEVPRLLDGGGSHAFMTREGNSYILVDASLPPVEMIAAISHELGHFVGGDVTPERIAALHNADSMDEYHTMERAADRIAADLLQADGLRALLERSLPYYAEVARDNHVTLGEAMETLDPHHPPVPERIAYLQSRGNQPE